MDYDFIIVGAGPAGIFAALELSGLRPEKKILILEKGQDLEKRNCPKRDNGVCRKCNPCNILSGFAGSGAYSDGKLSLSPEVGGELPSVIGYENTLELIKQVDQIYLSFGADKKIYGVENPELMDKLRARAIKSNLKLIECPIRHLGTDESRKIYKKIEDRLLSQGVQLSFNNPVADLIIDNGEIKGVVADKIYNADKVIIATGREGSSWLSSMCEKYSIKKSIGPVDIGVRVEVRNEIMKEINESLYEGKFIYYTPTFDDKVRTFCQNPAGFVSVEYYDNLAVVNGHSYKSKKQKSKNTNFAILVSNYFTKPFQNPIEYGKFIAGLGNMLSGNKIIVQRYGDLKRGRRTTPERLFRNNIHPTLSDSLPGDLSLVLPYRVLLDIKEMIEALDTIVSGVSSDETLLYGVEVKFYSSRIQTNENFETSIKNLYVAGDGAGITRGLMQSSVNGIYIGRLFA